MFDVPSELSLDVLVWQSKSSPSVFNIVMICFDMLSSQCVVCRSAAKYIIIASGKSIGTLNKENREVPMNRLSLSSQPHSLTFLAIVYY